MPAFRTRLAIARRKTRRGQCPQAATDHADPALRKKSSDGYDNSYQPALGGLVGAVADVPLEATGHTRRSGSVLRCQKICQKAVCRRMG